VKLTALATTANGRFCFQFAAKAIGTQTPEKRHRTNQLTLLFSGDLFAAKRRKGRPVEGLQARNELEQFVRNLS
jgi:hypothetical protein